ncbi:MAG: hypothetical protein AVDCRST_MAG54-3188, partial [uncultured Actinomycetospora sp.]
DALPAPDGVVLDAGHRRPRRT